MTSPPRRARAWVPLGSGTGFDIGHLPYGVFARPGEPFRCGIRIGDHVLDLARVSVPHGADFAQPALNAFMARGPLAWSAVRARVTELLSDIAFRDSVAEHLIDLRDVTLGLAWQVADYVDFYSSQDHAENVGRIFRPDSEPLPANWKHLPVAYHGRAGTVVVSGTPVIRPHGQRKPVSAPAPDFGPTRRLDIEAEVGFVVGAATEAGTAVHAAELADHVFGVVLLNDWSARDIQAWEYVPLGPFLGKSFATSVSAWVTPLAALDAARTQPPPKDTPELDYLHDPQPWALDLELEIEIAGCVVSKPPFSVMYWTPGQQLAHLTANGARLRTGDLFASGTVSGPGRQQRGSLLELSWGGREPLDLPTGRRLTFLEDGDSVTLRATATAADGGTIELGEVTGEVLPPVPPG